MIDPRGLPSEPSESLDLGSLGLELSAEDAVAPASPPQPEPASKPAETFEEYVARMAFEERTTLVIERDGSGTQSEKAGMMQRAARAASNAFRSLRELFRPGVKPAQLPAAPKAAEARTIVKTPFVRAMEGVRQFLPEGLRGSFDMFLDRDGFSDSYKGLPDRNDVSALERAMLDNLRISPDVKLAVAVERLIAPLPGPVRDRLRSLFDMDSFLRSYVAIDGRKDHLMVERAAIANSNLAPEERLALRMRTMNEFEGESGERLLEMAGELHGEWMRMGQHLRYGVVEEDMESQRAAGARGFAAMLSQPPESWIVREARFLIEENAKWAEAAEFGGMIVPEERELHRQLYRGEWFRDRGPEERYDIAERAAGRIGAPEFASKPEHVTIGGFISSKGLSAVFEGMGLEGVISGTRITMPGAKPKSSLERRRRRPPVKADLDAKIAEVQGLIAEQNNGMMPIAEKPMELHLHEIEVIRDVGEASIQLDISDIEEIRAPRASIVDALLGVEPAKVEAELRKAGGAVTVRDSADRAAERAARKARDSVRPKFKI